MINRLPWRKKLRTSAANNLDKINEIVDYINHSDISPVTLSDSASGRIVDVGMASSMKGLEVFGESIQNGVPTPDAPIPIRVVKGRNLLDLSAQPERVNGATYTTNGGTITVEATSASTWSYVAFSVSINPGDYVVSFVASETLFRIGIEWYNGTTRVGYKVATSGTATTFTVPTECNILQLVFYSRSTSSGAIGDSCTFANVQLEEGSTAHPFVPYGHIGLRVTADGETTVTPIPLPSKGFAASLPDGTRDVLTINSAGRYEWTNAIAERYFDETFNQWTFGSGNRFYCNLPDAVVAATPNNTATSNRLRLLQTGGTTQNVDGFNIAVFNNVMRFFVSISGSYPEIVTTNDFAAFLETHPIELYYKLATPTTEIGYIDVPEIPDSATVTIEATISPEFTIDWWSYQDITDMIADLMEYTDWKVSQVEGASTLGNNRLGSFPAVKEIAGEGKIKDEEAPAEIEDEKVPEEIEDTEDE